MNGEFQPSKISCSTATFHLNLKPCAPDSLKVKNADATENQVLLIDYSANMSSKIYLTTIGIWLSSWICKNCFAITMEIKIMPIAINFQAHFLSQMHKTKLMPDIKKSHKNTSMKLRSNIVKIMRHTSSGASI